MAPKSSKKAVLTIDDAPSAELGLTLSILAQSGIKAIFFCSGSQILNHRDSLVKALQDGHWLGNHGWDHRAFSTLSLNAGIAQIEETEALLGPLRAESDCDHHPRLFRFPYGDRGLGLGSLRTFLGVFHPKVRALQRYLRTNEFRSPAQVGLPVPSQGIGFSAAVDWLWSCDSRDWVYSKAHASPDEYLQWMSTQFSTQSVVDDTPIFLFHDHPGHHRYLQVVLPMLAERFAFGLPGQEFGGECEYFRGDSVLQ